jgi:hypothetical protein
MTERLASRIAARRPPARWCARIAGKAISTTANSQTATSGRALTPQAERTTEQRAGQKNPLALMHPHRHATRSLCASPETQPPPEPPSAPLHSRGPRGVKPDVTVPSGETAVQARQNPTASGHTQSERPTASDARANSNAGLDPHVARRLLFAKLAFGGEGRPGGARAPSCPRNGGTWPALPEIRVVVAELVAAEADGAADSVDVRRVRAA